MWRTIRTLDGRVIGQSNPTIFTAWNWIERIACAEWECSPDALDLVETDAGDCISINGRVVARIELGMGR